MRSLITNTLFIFSSLVLSISASAATEIKVPDNFEAFNGLYKLQKAKGPRKEYCSKVAPVYFSSVEFEGKIITIANVTSKILVPIANMNKKFVEADGCETLQSVRLLEMSDKSSIAINETLKETCPKTGELNTERILEFNSRTKRLSFLMTENGKNAILCQWLKR